MHELDHDFLNRIILTNVCEADGVIAPYFSKKIAGSTVALAFRLFRFKIDATAACSWTFHRHITFFLIDTSKIRFIKSDVQSI